MKQYWKYFVFVGLLVSMFALLNVVGLLPPIKGFFTTLLNPVTSFFYTKGRDSRTLAVTATTSKEALLAEVERLNNITLQLLLEKSQVQTILNENRELKQLLAFKEKINYSLNVGRVITRSSDFSDKFIVINVGAKDGVKKGFAVVANEGTIVGKVLRADENNSVVRLLVDRNSSLAVSLGAHRQTQGILQGRRGLTFEMDLIPQDVVLKKDMLVKTSGLEDVIPAGLVVGLVDTAEESSNALFQKAIIKPIVNFDALDVVGVIVFE